MCLCERTIGKKRPYKSLKRWCIADNVQKMAEHKRKAIAGSAAEGRAEKAGCHDSERYKVRLAGLWRFVSVFYFYICMAGIFIPHFYPSFPGISAALSRLRFFILCCVLEKVQE